jgi:hypothetical protein
MRIAVVDDPRSVLGTDDLDCGLAQDQDVLKASVKLRQSIDRRQVSRIMFLHSASRSVSDRCYEILAQRLPGLAIADEEGVCPFNRRQCMTVAVFGPFEFDLRHRRQRR